MKLNIRCYLQNFSKITKKGAVYVILDFNVPEARRKTIQIPLPIKIEKKFWLKTGRVSKTHPNSKIFNEMIEIEIGKVGETINFMKIRDIPLNPETYQKTKENKSDSGQDLLTLVKKFNLSQSENFTGKHLEKFKNLESRLEDYLEGKKVYPTEINQNWITGFTKYLQKAKPDHKKPNLRKSQQPNTIVKTFDFLKQILKYYVDENIIQPNYKKLKFQKELDVKQVVLSVEDIQKLEDYQPASERLSKIKDLALIQLYTGLRYSDCIRLRAGHVQGHMLVIANKKTGSSSSILLFEALNRLLEKYGFDTTQLTISNQKYNDYLKEIFKEVGLTTPIEKVTYNDLGEMTVEFIPKYDLITTHTMRRTFVTQTLYGGMDRKIIQRTTAHRSEKQMDEYFHAQPEMVLEQVSKLNQIFPGKK